MKPVYLKATGFKSPSSTGLLKLLAPSGDTPELLAPSTGLLEVLVPCGGMTELLVPWQVTLMGRILTASVSLPHRHGCYRMPRFLYAPIPSCLFLALKLPPGTSRHIDLL